MGRWKYRTWAVTARGGERRKQKSSKTNDNNEEVATSMGQSVESSGQSCRAKTSPYPSVFQHEDDRKFCKRTDLGNRRATMRELPIDRKSREVSATNGSNSVVFDRRPRGVTLAFYPSRPSTPDGARWLWWSRCAPPEVIDEVVCALGRQRLGVETIVIGGLERYPVRETTWPRWLARWSRAPGPSTIVVDTKGLPNRRRRRLMDSTRRRIALSKDADPVTAVTTAIKYWITRRFR